MINSDLTNIDELINVNFLKVCSEIKTFIKGFDIDTFRNEGWNSKETEELYQYILIIIAEIDQNIIPFFEGHIEKLTYRFGDINITEALDSYLDHLVSNVSIDLANLKEILNHYSNEIIKIYLDFYHGIDEYFHTKKIIDQLEEQLFDAKNAVKNIESAKRALEGQKTEEIYSAASDNFLNAARNYEVFFYMLIGAALIITVICLAYFPYSEATKINFIFSKILTATLVITLGTLFLRKAAHLRKLHEQAHQTSLELQALPLYLANVTPDHQAEIYKDLASKYFGKELDKTQHDKIGDLMQDQLAAGTELIKASAEMVKSVKPSGASDSNNSNL